MSYILDALRRADAERSRGAVPGLHAQGLPADVEPAARDYRPLIWAAGGAGVLLVAGVVILLVAPWKSVQVPPESRAALAPTPDLSPTPRDAAAAFAPVQMAQGELPAAQPGAIEPGARPVEPPIGRGAAPQVAPAPAPAPQPYPPTAQAVRAAQRDTLADRAAEGRVATLEPRAAARATAAPPSPVPAQAPVEHYGPAIAPGTAPATAAARSNAVPNIKDLPPDVRSQLPKLAVAGSVYSETPSARMVIFNGQVFHEGDKLGPDTVLEQIRLKSAILNFRGQRYEITF
ncbi:MAG TPA: general secretion pathway protein GspB [Burkholderiaceae bacterium]